MKLSALQYKILSELYHEFNEAFECLSEDIKQAFYKKLYQGEQE